MIRPRSCVVKLYNAENVVIDERSLSFYELLTLTTCIRNVPIAEATSYFEKGSFINMSKRFATLHNFIWDRK